MGAIDAAANPHGTTLMGARGSTVDRGAPG
jgi:hypothetical protein